MLKILFLICCLISPSIACADAFGVEMGAKAEKYGIAESPMPYMYILKDVPMAHISFTKYLVIDTPKSGISLLQAQTKPTFSSSSRDNTFDFLVEKISNKYNCKGEDTYNSKDALSQFFNISHDKNAVVFKPKNAKYIEEITVSKLSENDRSHVIVILYNFKNKNDRIEEFKKMWEEAF